MYLLGKIVRITNKILVEVLVCQPQYFKQLNKVEIDHFLQCKLFSFDMLCECLI